jgi:hypothetical protein
MADINPGGIEKHADSEKGNRIESVHSNESLTGINEKALLRKLDLILLPPLTLLYLLSFLDRSNGELSSPILILPATWLTEQ